MINIYNNFPTLIFTWWDKYHHSLLLIILGTLILLIALTLQKNAYTVRYINYLTSVSIIILLILLPMNNATIASSLWFIDDYLYLFFYTIGAVFIAVTLINVSELNFIKENKDIEFPLLILMGFIATTLLIGSTNLISAFIALECLAFISYVLVAFERNHKLSSLAGVRYLFLGAVPTGIFVLGIVELYSFLGTFNLEDAEKLTKSVDDLVILQNNINQLLNSQNELNIITFPDFINTGVIIENLISLNNNINEDSKNLNFIVSLINLEFFNNIIEINSLSDTQIEKSNTFYKDLVNEKKINSLINTYSTHYSSMDISNNTLNTSILIGENLNKNIINFSFDNLSNNELLGNFWLIDNFINFMQSFNNYQQWLDINLWINSLELSNKNYLESLYFKNYLLNNIQNNIFFEFNVLQNTHSPIINDIFLSNNYTLLEVIKQFTVPNLPIIVKIAILFISVNLLFKITAAPFNMWAPRIYDGAPLPIVMFLSIFSKIAVIFFMIRFFLAYFYDFLTTWSPIFLLCGLGSMIAAISGAISETKIKRFFVYSSMSHVGLMLLSLSCATLHGGKAIIVYLIVYTITSLGGWTIIMLLTNKVKKIKDKKIIYLTNLKGLAKNNALLSFFLAIVMLSMGGIPPLAGFFAKFEILYALSEAQLFSIAFTALLLSVISFFYYLRIIKILYFDPVKSYTIQYKKNTDKAFILSIGFLFTIFFVLYLQQPIFYCIRSIFKTFFNEIFMVQ